jgi:hypothetical protein
LFRGVSGTDLARVHLPPAQLRLVDLFGRKMRGLFGRELHKLLAMDPMEPADCLRSLAAAALMRAHPDRPLFPVSLGLMAVANALVMLGLLPEPEAEAILAGHQVALERKGFPDVWGVTRGELTVRPGAHEYWQSRAAGSGGLREVPLSVAAAGVRCPTSVADVGFEWVKLTSAGLQLSFHATAPYPGAEPADPQEPMRQALSEISLTGDAGRFYDLSAVRVGWGRSRDRQEWHGRVLVAQDPASTPAWLEFTPTAAGAPARVALPPPAQVPVGASDLPWPTAAECYLAALAPVTHISIEAAPSGDVAEAGPEETAEIIATVADSLMAVGALPVSSTLLREFPASGPGWHTPLVHRWGRRAHRVAQGRGTADVMPGTVDFRPAEHRGLAVRLPLEHATAVIESISAQGELVSVQLYGHPWVHGEYWPMITPCFQVRAIDDAGNEHEGIAGGGQVSPGHEGSGEFWFWPPVDPARKSLRVTVSTLWEAAWAEIELPR